MNEKDIYLYGCGGHSKVILDILYQQKRKVTAFIDDNPSLNPKTIHGISILASQEALFNIKSDNSLWIVAIGDNYTRQKVAKKLTDQGYHFTTAIHPRSQIALGVTISPGTVIMANAVINTDTQIGSHVIVNTGSTIDHDCQIQDYCHIAPGCSLCGKIKLGEGVFLGVGTKVCPGIEIGSYTTCGAGSVVVKSLPNHCLAYGCPAQVMR